MPIPPPVPSHESGRWEARTACLSFQYQGEVVVWEFLQPDDWVSDGFLENIERLVRAETSGELMSLPTNDQFMCLVYLPEKLSNQPVILDL